MKAKTTPHLLEDAVGIHLIVYYKLGKGALQSIASVALLLVVVTGHASRLHSLALTLREHVVHAWSIALAELLLRGITPHRLELTSLAIALDAVLSLLEGWFLHRRYSWAPWPVVVAGAIWIPFEVIHLSHHPTAGRLALVVVNVVIVAYLVARVLGERRRHAAAHRRHAP